MIVLDTNVISEIFRPAPEPRVVEWLDSLTGDVAITAITLGRPSATTSNSGDQPNARIWSATSSAAGCSLRLRAGS